MAFCNLDCREKHIVLEEREEGEMLNLRDEKGCGGHQFYTECLIKSARLREKL